MTTPSEQDPEPVDETSSSPMKVGRKLTLLKVLSVIGGLLILAALGLPFTRNARPAARRSYCMNNLKQIGLALRNYESEYKVLPPAYTVDADGKPLHSWRTLILPYLDQKPLYQTIDLAKPWDDPVNSKACNTSVPAFHCLEARCPTNFTTYMAIVATNSCFRATEPRPLSEITDDHGLTMMVVEVDSVHAAHWMAPVDADEQLVLGFGPKTRLAHSKSTYVLQVDGSVRTVGNDTPTAQRRAAISIAGDDSPSANQ